LVRDGTARGARDPPMQITVGPGPPSFEGTGTPGPPR